MVQAEGWSRGALHHPGPSPGTWPKWQGEAFPVCSFFIALNAKPLDEMNGTQSIAIMRGMIQRCSLSPEMRAHSEGEREW